MAALLPKGLGGLLVAVPVVIFSMMGSEVAAIAAAESADPAHNIARAARTVALRILFFYVLSISVIVAVLPWDSITVGLSPFTPVLDRIGIPGSGAVMSIIIITAVLSCLNSGLYITSRMLHELGTHGDAPIFLAGTAKNKVPVAGILIGCAAGFLAALAQLFLREDVFTLLASTSGDIILFIYHDHRARADPPAPKTRSPRRGAALQDVACSRGSATPSSPALPAYSCCSPSFPISKAPCS
jgi:GABA permease